MYSICVRPWLENSDPSQYYTVSNVETVHLFGKLWLHNFDRFIETQLKEGLILSLVYLTPE